MFLSGAAIGTLGRIFLPQGEVSLPFQGVCHPWPPPHNWDDPIPQVFFPNIPFPESLLVSTIGGCPLVTLGSLVVSTLPDPAEEPATFHFDLGSEAPARAGESRVPSDSSCSWVPSSLRGRFPPCCHIPGLGRIRAALITLGTQTQDPETDTMGPAYRHPPPTEQTRGHTEHSLHKTSTE